MCASLALRTTDRVIMILGLCFFVLSNWWARVTKDHERPKPEREYINTSWVSTFYFPTSSSFGAPIQNWQSLSTWFCSRPHAVALARYYDRQPMALLLRICHYTTKSSHRTHKPDSTSAFALSKPVLQPAMTEAFSLSDSWIEQMVTVSNLYKKDRSTSMERRRIEFRSSYSRTSLTMNL